MRKESTQRHARKRINKENTAVDDNSFANPFSDFPIERQKGNPWNPDLDFLIEIHPEDGFVGGEIRFRISPFDCKIRNPDFSIERNPSIHSYNTRSSPSNNLYVKKSRLDRELFQE